MAHSAYPTSALARRISAGAAVERMGPRVGGHKHDCVLSHWEPAVWALVSHGDAAAKRKSTGGRRRSRTGRVLLHRGEGFCGTLRRGLGHVCLHWDYDESALCTNLHASAKRRSADHWRTISKQGNSLLRFLLVEAAQVTVRSDQ